MKRVIVIKDLVVEEVPYGEVIRLSKYIPEGCEEGLMGEVYRHELQMEHTILTPREFVRRCVRKGNEVIPEGWETAYWDERGHQIIECREYIAVSPLIQGTLGKYINSQAEEIKLWRDTTKGLEQAVNVLYKQLDDYQNKFRQYNQLNFWQRFMWVVRGDKV